MMILVEGDLRFEFDDAISAIKFDDASHQLTHCMKCVDFIVEFEPYYVFVEVKDPELPAIVTIGVADHVQQARLKATRQFLERYRSGQLNAELIAKFRDTFLYRWAEEKLDKPIYYLLLLELPSVDNGFYLTKADDLARNLPYAKHGRPSSSWKRSLVAGCACFGIAQWNGEFTKWRVSRIAPQQDVAVPANNP